MRGRFLPQQQKKIKERAKKRLRHFNGAAYIWVNSVIITIRVGFSAFSVPSTSSRQKANQSAVIGQQESDLRLNRLVCFWNCFPPKKINYTMPKHGGRRHFLYSRVSNSLSFLEDTDVKFGDVWLNVYYILKIYIFLKRQKTKNPWKSRPGWVGKLSENQKSEHFCFKMVTFSHLYW